MATYDNQNNYQQYPPNNQYQQNPNQQQYQQYQQPQQYPPPQQYPQPQQYNPNEQPANYYDYEGQQLLGKATEGLLGCHRLGFIRKVYLILSTQLLVTVIFTICALYSESFGNFQWTNGGQVVYYIFLSFAFIVECAILCYPKNARKVPTNYILLGIFTLCFSYCISGICSLVKDGFGGNIVLAAACMTLGLTVALTLYALTTKTDFTMMGGFLWCFCTIFIFFWIFVWAWNIYMYMFWCSLCVILYSFYLIYDTQLIAGQKRHKLGYDDYIIGALIIYVDIIILFLRILQILMAAKR